SLASQKPWRRLKASRRVPSGEDVLALGAAQFEFGDERQVVAAAGFGQQLLEGGFCSALVADALVAIGAERLVIALDRLVRRLQDRGGRHGQGDLGCETGCILTRWRAE